MTILVTGGAGFIGSHLVEELVKRGRKVRVLDNFTSGRKENLEGVINKIHLIKGDIREFKTVTRAMKGVKYVIHQAALKSVPLSLVKPAQFNEVNVKGTLNILIAARNARVKRVIYASSSSVYGDVRKFPEKESFPSEPISPYGATKVMSEIYCQTFSKVYQLETVALRYFNVFGPRQDPLSPYAAVIPKFIQRLLRNKPPVIFGNGKQSRDFTYIGNVVTGTLAALVAPMVSGKVINLACGKPYTVLELVEYLNQIMDKDIKAVFTSPRPGDILHSYADISLARKYLGFRMKVGFAEGLRNTVAWFGKME